jgi:hypothetical protein
VEKSSVRASSLLTMALVFRYILLYALYNGLSAP